MDRADRDTPGVVAPPPVLYLGTLATGFVLGAIRPITAFPSPMFLRVLGVLLLVLSGVIVRWAFITMQRSQAHITRSDGPAALVVRGPFRYSRNPIYVAMTGLYLGGAFLADSAWLLLLLVPLLAVMQWGVVLREERLLEARFGDAYRLYKRTTPRWL